MSKYTPTTEQVNAFKAAWHDADDDGQAGKRVEIALAKVLGPACAAARREGQAEALRAAARSMRSHKDPGHWNLRDEIDPVNAGQSPDAWLERRADRIENGADQ